MSRLLELLRISYYELAGYQKTARIWAQLRIMTCSISTLHQGPGHICKVLFRLQKIRNAFVRILQEFQHFSALPLQEVHSTSTMLDFCIYGCKPEPVALASGCSGCSGCSTLSKHCLGAKKNICNRNIWNILYYM